jgi:hypothetical protein
MGEFATNSSSIGMWKLSVGKDSMNCSVMCRFTIVRTLALFAAIAFPGSLRVEAGVLSGDFAEVPEGSTVDLTREGTIDWVHWGLHTPSSLNRKAGVPALIGDFILQDASNGFAYVYQYADNYNGYTWYDGCPKAAVTNTPTGVWVYGIPTIGSGFRYEVPADVTERILKVYVGVFAGVGHFEAFLSDNSAPGYTNGTLMNLRNGPGRVYTIQYAADSPDQRLIIRWILNSPRDPTANVTLQAAALTAPAAVHPPIALLTAPAQNQNFDTSSIIPLAAFASGQVVRVEFFDGEMKIGEDTTSPYTLDWSNAPVGLHGLSARAIDTLTAGPPCAPVEIFVHGTGGSLTGSVAFPPAFVDLTSEGIADWTHWGLITSDSFNRKSGVEPQISTLTTLGTNSPAQYSNNYTSFSWTDGTPVVAEGGTPTGIFIIGFTNGFKITAPADTTPRRLKVYAGLYGAMGNFQAFLSDGSARAYADTSLDSIFSDVYGVYTIDYAAASAGQTLLVRYRSSCPYDMDYGNVTLQAATLAGPVGPPLLRITNPRLLNNALLFSFPTESGRTYTVQYAPEVSSAEWQTLATITGDGNEATVTDPDIAHEHRFYRVRVP